jgi:hypothetical protein
VSSFCIRVRVGVCVGAARADIEIDIVIGISFGLDIEVAVGGVRLGMERAREICSAPCVCVREKKRKPQSFRRAAAFSGVPG